MAGSRRHGLRIAAALTLCGVAACSSGPERARGSSTSTSSRTSPPSTSSASTTSSTTTSAGTATRAWPTYYHDNARSGAASDGPASPDGVRRQWSSPELDGDVYAQPLIVGDRVVIATTNDTVYSLNARDGSVEWKNHLAEPVSGSSLPCGNVDPVGITSTPVIDTSAGRIYAVGMVRPGRHMLFALDLETGHLRSSKRVDANGADPAVHNQRGALLLSEGKVFVPFGGRDGDCGDYHGRVVSVDVRSADLGTVKSYTLPTKGEGGFWAPPGAVDAGDGTFYLASGNSSSDGDYDYGNSVVRLTTNLALRDSFAPTNWVSLNNGDVDLGSSSPVLLSGNRIFQIGKAGTGYILDAADLGGIGGARNSAHVCSGGGWGGIAHDDDTLFVPCSGGIVQVTAPARRLRCRVDRELVDARTDDRHGRRGVERRH
ncbi:MAG: hypothetical protein E6G60_21910 [Actinobacteria bacterium]|nr:MAG: hypothetical protein E6G60_21910 [Actinomycetota bacterium]